MYNMIAYKFCAFTRTVFLMFETALPLKYCPAIKIIGAEFRKDSPEIDLSVTQRSKAASPINPGLIDDVSAVFGSRIRLCILYVNVC